MAISNIDTRAPKQPGHSVPRIHDPPSGPDGLMMFDGICNFCSGTVRIVTRMDRVGVIRFTAMQSDYGRTLCRTQGIDPDDPSTFIFFDRGRALEATEAMLAMVARLPRPWRWLQAFAVIPRPLRDAAYHWTARNRYKLLGKRQACMVPTPALRARFIDQVPPP